MCAVRVRSQACLRVVRTLPDYLSLFAHSAIGRRLYFQRLNLRVCVVNTAPFLRRKYTWVVGRGETQLGA